MLVPTTLAGVKRSLAKPAYADIYRFFTTTARGAAQQTERGGREASASSGEASGRRWAEGARRVALPGAGQGRGYSKSTLGGGELLQRFHQSRAIDPYSNRQHYSTNSSSKCPAPDCPHQASATPPPTDPHYPTSLDHSYDTFVPAAPTKPVPHPSYLNSLPVTLRRLAAALPTSPGRPPSQDQVLALTSSFFQRLRIRFKWATIRSYRRFRVDDYSAFFSVGIAGTLGWFLIGTTSFFAFCFFIVNSLSLQEWLARKLGDYLTAQSGVTVIFESAIVPKWGLVGGGSKILFKNVYISRGPAKAELGVLPLLGDEVEETKEQIEAREMMAKWSHFHLSIDSIEVSLSIRRWLDGKGLVKDATVTGTRGVLDRSHVQYDPDAPRDRFAYRHVSHPGDFWLENLQIEDFLVTVYQPDHFRPYTFSIFTADIRKLRKQWLFYDLMSADSITGQVDNCLFSLHKPQSIGRTSEEDLKDAQWARMSRFRIDGVPIDHMQSAHDAGVLSWVTSGRCDLVADIRFPRDESELDLSAIVADIVDKFADTVEKLDKEIGAHLLVDKGKRIPGQRVLSREALKVPKGWTVEEEKARKRAMIAASLGSEEVVPAEEEAEVIVEEEKQHQRVSIDLDIRFKDLKASVPFFTTDLTYVNNALVRPIVAFINSNRTLIPIRCHIDLSLDEFDGSWTTYDVGVIDRISEQTYAALAHHVQNANHQRLQTVSLWTLQLTANAVLSAFKHNLAQY